MGDDLGKLAAPKLFGRKKRGESSTSAAPRRAWRRPRLGRSASGPLSISGWVAAMLAGLVAGVLLSGLTWAAESALDPAGSNRVAAAVLVAIFVVSVVGGALTLRVLRVPSSGTIAFLGTAVVTIIALIAFSAHLDDATGATAGVVLSVLAYPLSRWVTVRYIDEG